MSRFASWNEWIKTGKIWKSENVEEPIVESEPSDDQPANDSIAKINEATEEQLVEIKGIGAVTAGKILENKPYDSFRSLAEKTSLKKTVLERLETWASS